MKRKAFSRIYITYMINYKYISNIVIKFLIFLWFYKYMYNMYIIIPPMQLHVFNIILYQYMSSVQLFKFNIVLYKKSMIFLKDRNVWRSVIKNVLINDSIKSRLNVIVYIFYIYEYKNVSRCLLFLLLNFYYFIRFL